MGIYCNYFDAALYTVVNKAFCYLPRSLGAVSVLLGQIVRGTSAGARVFEFTDLRPSIPIHSGLKLPLADLRGEIELKGVSFTYPSRAEQLVLKNLDLKILPGKVTALCGPSGSGRDIYRLI